MSSGRWDVGINVPSEWTASAVIIVGCPVVIIEKRPSFHYAIKRAPDVVTIS